MKNVESNVSRREVLAAGVAALGASLAVPLRAWAQDAGRYPSKPITFIVGFPPGTSSDTFARLLATGVSKSLGVPVVVENRPGLSTMLAARQVADMRPGDGYKLFLGNNSLWMVQPVIEPKPGFAFDDFDHLMMLGETPYVLVARPDRGWKTLADLVAEAKRRPGKINYGSTGAGGTLHLVVERLMEVTGMNLTHIPYKGAVQAQTDVLGGQIELLFDSVPSSMGMVRSGRLVALAISTRERFGRLPNVLTVAEQGYPGFSMYGWWSLATPAGTPPAALDTIARAFTAALGSKVVKTYFEDNALLPVPSTREYLLGRIASEGPVYRTLLKRLNIKPQSS